MMHAMMQRAPRTSRARTSPTLIILGIAFFVASPTSLAFRIPLSFSTMSASAAAISQQQFAPQAISLFNNMKTPASIIAGAMVPLGFMAPVPLFGTGDNKEGRIETLMRRSYTPVAAAALLSEFISIVFATVAVNQLTETAVEPASSVWALIQRDYDLAWAGTNAHFVFGMFSFVYLIAIRGYFNIGGGLLGRGVVGLAASALLYMVGIVNRGVSSGSGDGKLSYGNSVIGLFRNYFALVLTRKKSGCGAFRPMELGAVALTIVSLIVLVQGILQKD